MRLTIAVLSLVLGMIFAVPAFAVDENNLPAGWPTWATPPIDPAAHDAINPVITGLVGYQLGDKYVAESDISTKSDSAEVKTLSSFGDSSLARMIRIPSWVPKVAMEGSFLEIATQEGLTLPSGKVLPVGVIRDYDDGVLTTIMIVLDKSRPSPALDETVLQEVYSALLNKLQLPAVAPAGDHNSLGWSEKNGKWHVMTSDHDYTKSVVGAGSVSDGFMIVEVGGRPYFPFREAVMAMATSKKSKQ